MKIVKAAKWAILVALIALVSLSGGVYGVTGNYEADSTPYVGVVVLFSDAARTNPIGYCSGFLLSPTVMVTAGHSLVGAQAISVCFDQGPISYTRENGEIVYYGASTIYDGQMVPYPLYNPSFSGNSEFATSDIGLIILNQEVTEVTDFPALPKEGFTDTLDMKTKLKEIGYGLQFQLTPKNTGVVNSWVETLSCNTATAQLISGNFADSDKYLKLTANPSQGKGGVAFGDSGGPVIYNSGSQDIVLSLIHISEPTRRT